MASHEYFFLQFFFGVTRDLIDHFGEEIVWLPFFSQIYLITAYYKASLLLSCDNHTIKISNIFAYFRTQF